MKIKGLLFGLFACAALAACTNEDIVDNNGNGEQEKVKGNLTLVIAASSDSSRATTNEEGESTDKGTNKESTVKNALVILAPINNATDEFAGDQIVETVNEAQLNRQFICLLLN